MTQIIVGGIEGGGTHSTLVLLDESGKELTRVSGPDTNHWTIGMSQCQKRIADMVSRAKAQAGIPVSQPLYALGLCLSGCEQEESNVKLWQGLKESYPHVSERYTVSSDTDGSVATVAPNGGMVLISGTGSNCLLINPDGGRYQCGGWGWMLGDEGSAWWISLKAIKTIFDDHDGLIKSKYCTNWVWQAIRDHFQVDSRPDLLDHCYTSFEKHKFAGLCRKLAEGAAVEGDALCKHLFISAGEVLAQTVLAQVPRASAELITKPGGLQVLCVGSVWKSWELLKPGFVPRLQQDSSLEELSLTRLTTTTAMGAAYLAAERCNVTIPKTYGDNYQVFYHYKR